MLNINKVEFPSHKLLADLIQSPVFLKYCVKITVAITKFISRFYKGKLFFNHNIIIIFISIRPPIIFISFSLSAMIKDNGK